MLSKSADEGWSTLVRVALPGGKHDEDEDEAEGLEAFSAAMAAAAAAAALALASRSSFFFCVICA